MAVCAGLVVAALVPGSACAQITSPLLESEIPFDLRDPDRPTVLQRRQERQQRLDQLGLRVRSFRVLAQAETAAGYTSNVFGAAEATEADSFVDLVPSIDVRSDWGRHMLNARILGDLRRYISNPVRDQTGYDALAEGRADLARGELYGRLQARRTFSEPYSGDFPEEAAEAIPIDGRTAVVRASVEAGRMSVIASGDMNRIDYEDVRSRTGTVVDQDYRDVTVWRGSARGEFEVGPARSLFAQGSYLIHDYDAKDAGTLDRSGTETRLLVGAAFYLTPLLRTRAAVGYLWREYDDPTVSDLAAPAVDIQADYLLSQLTTLSASVGREAQDSILFDSPGYIATTFRLRADHELLRNLLLFGHGAVELLDYEDIDRDDTIIRVEAGADYTPFRHLVLGPRVQWLKRDSSGGDTGLQFDEVRVLVAATVRL